jgi:hypothetical protein
MADPTTGGSVQWRERHLSGAIRIESEQRLEEGRHVSREQVGLLMGAK